MEEETQSLSIGTARLYGYEKPSLTPGGYNITVTQSLTAEGHESSSWETPPVLFNVKATPPYILPPALLHSYYPPNLQRVPAETLPHVIVNGAVPWEREPNAAAEPTEAPLPWLALLLFKEDGELVVPADMIDEAHKPTGTLSIRLPPAKVAEKFTDRHAVSHPKEEADANFIFLKAAVFKSYFEDQTKPGDPGQNAPDLSRYKYLVHVKEVGLDPPDTPQEKKTPPTKVSTILAHRVRCPASGPPQKIVAHLVSLEGVPNIKFAEAAKEDAVFALASLWSWSFEWDSVSESQEHYIFNGLETNIRPLSMDIKTPIPENASPTQRWIRTQVENGYTLVRHRAISGEKSVALFRGPLVPTLGPRAQLQPSMHGTDLQVLDAETQTLDVSYSVAWDLGRSVAARTPQFSKALAAARRHLFLLATTGKVPSSTGAGADEVDAVLNKLDELFKDSVASKLTSLPGLGVNRWLTQTPTKESQPSAAFGTMTAAKLQRNLTRVGETHVQPYVIQLAESDAPAVPASASIDGLRELINWIISNLFSLKAVPALYMFPDPSILVPERVMTFYIDDDWVDAMIDGALSVGNTAGGIVDAVREEIRKAINIYITKRNPESLNIVRQGFVIRSSCIEAFPDLELKPASAVVHKTRNQDMLMCLLHPGNLEADKPLEMEISQPPHQLRFGMSKIDDNFLSQSFALEAFRKDGAIPIPGETLRTWKRVAEAQTTPDLPNSVLNFDTGILIPSALATAHIQVAKELLGDNFKPLDDKSKSVYLAVQLQDQPSSLKLPFQAFPGRSASTRQLFPSQNLVSPSTQPKGSTSTHVPKGETPETPSSCWVKTVFALQYPGKNIPVRSYPPVDLVFSIKRNDENAGDARLLEMDITIPIGDGAEELLAPGAALPTTQMIGMGAFISTCYFESAAALVIRLRPRHATITMKRADASFLLIGATINGVLGKEVPIRSRELILKEGKRQSVEDVWTVAKE